MYCSTSSNSNFVAAIVSGVIGGPHAVVVPALEGAVVAGHVAVAVPLAHLLAEAHAAAGVAAAAV